MKILAVTLLFGIALSVKMADYSGSYNYCPYCLAYGLSRGWAWSWCDDFSGDAYYCNDRISTDACTPGWVTSSTAYMCYSALIGTDGQMSVTIDNDLMLWKTETPTMDTFTKGTTAYTDGKLWSLTNDLSDDTWVACAMWEAATSYNNFDVYYSFDGGDSWGSWSSGSAYMIWWAKGVTTHIYAYGSTTTADTMTVYYQSATKMAVAAASLVALALSA